MPIFNKDNGKVELDMQEIIALLMIGRTIREELRDFKPEDVTGITEALDQFDRVLAPVSGTTTVSSGIRGIVDGLLSGISTASGRISQKCKVR